MGLFKVRHETTYRYRSVVSLGEHRLMLRPRESHDQRVVEYGIEIRPEPTAFGWSEDASGNLVGSARFGRRTRELSVVATMSVDHTPFREAALAVADHARTCPFSYGAEEMPDLARFIERQHPDAQHDVDGWAKAVRAEDPDRGTWTFLTRLNATIRRDFAYLRREEAGIQPPAQTLHLRRGSCRDFAVLMAEAVRTQGIAARFVSGYLYVRSADETVRRVGGSTHAWIQVYLPGGGWIDFDPTSGAVGNGDLVRVAVVRDPAQASPLAGSFMGFPSDFIDMSVTVDVTAERSRRSEAQASAVAA